MLVQQFMRIPEFSQVPPSELRALATRSHVLCVPPRRWLIRSGKQFDAYFYLLKGSVQTYGPPQKLRAVPLGRLRHFYPGCLEARTLGACQVLRIDAPQREFLLKGGERDALSPLSAESWLQRFLNSHMMQHLSPQQWQQTLAAFELQCFSPGSRIVSSGAPAQHCFVIESGHVVVHSDGRTLAHLCPGDFFGEDALVLDSVRTANVSTLDEVRVHAVQRDVFLSAVLENLVQFVACRQQGTTLCLDGRVEHGMTIDLSELRGLANSLDPRDSYYVCGGEPSERALAALLLMQQGLQANPVE